MKINPIYVPIIQWKQGEQGALKELSTNVKDKIIPLITLTPNFNENRLDLTLKNWIDRPFYFDVLPECYDLDDEIYFRVLRKLDPTYVIPVLFLDDDIDVIKEASKLSDNGFALRITSEYSDEIEAFINNVLCKFSPSNIDLIIDMKSINEENHKEKYLVLKSLLIDIPDLSLFRNVILSSSSFPETLSSIKSGQLGRIPRCDWALWLKCIKKINVKFNINLIYSDHCINSTNYVSFIPGMSPSFNIRYTCDSCFLILKGKSIKKGGLDGDNVSELCNVLTSSPEFKGKSFSWGDNYIFEHSSDTENSYGNLSTWRKVGTNHHIALVIYQLSNLL